MPLHPTRVCPCHGKPMFVDAHRRPQCHEKRKATLRRYNRSPHGKAVIDAYNDAYPPIPVSHDGRRIRVPRAQQATVQAHIKRRRDEFRQRQRNIGP